MAAQSRVITVGTNATLLNTGNKIKMSTQDVVSCAIYVPSGGQTVYVGGLDVSTTNGFPIPAGGTLTPELAVGNDALYAVVATGTQPVNVLTTGV